jgi:hypothetical protein
MMLIVALIALRGHSVYKLFAMTLCSMAQHYNQSAPDNRQEHQKQKKMAEATTTRTGVGNSM